MADPVKTLVDQVRELDKLVSDGIDKLTQAKVGLRSLEDRLNAQSDQGRPAAAGQPNSKRP